MKTLYKRRLLQLAKHLESGKLGHETFDCTCVNADKYGWEMNDNGCGSHGCALGELPFAFPKLWHFLDGQPALRNASLVFSSSGWQRKRTFRYADCFFGLSTFETDALFVPRTNHLKWLKTLTECATPRQVASNIRAFVKHRDGVE